MCVAFVVLICVFTCGGPQVCSGNMSTLDLRAALHPHYLRTPGTCAQGLGLGQVDRPGRRATPQHGH